jgi:nitrate reductase alpha subunit
VRRYTDMPMLVMLKEHTLPGGEKIMVPDRYVRASDFEGQLGAPTIRSGRRSLSTKQARSC